MTEYELVGGQRLTNVHAPDQCFGEWCCIHNPSPHHMVYWPQNWRADRRIMERVCPHGIGHPDPDDPKTSDYYEGIHGCDGCCFDPDDDESTVEFQLDPSTDSLLSDSDNVVTPDDSDIIVTIFGHLIPCGHTHYKGCEPCGCCEYRDVTERSQDEGVDVRTRSELSQFADQGTTEVSQNENTTTVAIQADEQPMSTDSASNHYDRSVVTGTNSTSPTYATCVPVATGSSRSDRLRAVAQQAHDDGDCVCCLPDPDTITITISRISAEALMEGDVSTQVRDACRAALEGEK